MRAPRREPISTGHVRVGARALYEADREANLAGEFWPSWRDLSPIGQQVFVDRLINVLSAMNLAVER